MKGKIEQLSAETRRLVSAGLGPRRRYPAEFRERVATAAHGRCESGESVAAVAREFGLRSRTLARWLRAAPKRRWRRVMMAEATERVAPPITVIAGELRIEGIDVDGVARLLRLLA